MVSGTNQLIYVYTQFTLCMFYFQHSVLFCNDSDGSEESHRRASTARSFGNAQAEAASSPESFASARDGVINNKLNFTLVRKINK